MHVNRNVLLPLGLCLAVIERDFLQECAEFEWRRVTLCGLSSLRRGVRTLIVGRSLYRWLANCFERRVLVYALGIGCQLVRVTEL